MSRWLVTLAAASLTACVDVSPRLFQMADGGPDQGPALDRALDARPPVDLAPPLDDSVDRSLIEPLPDSTIGIDEGAADGAPDVPLDAEVDVALDMAPDPDLGPPPPCGPTGVYFEQPDLCLVVLRPLDALLSPRAGHTLTRVGVDTFVVTGGDRGPDHADSPLAERLIVDGRQMESSPLPGLDGERIGQDAVWLDDGRGHLILAGGRTLPDGAPVRGVAVYDLMDADWIEFTEALTWGHDGGTVDEAYNAHALIIGGVGGIGDDADTEMVSVKHMGGAWTLDHYHRDLEREVDERTMPLTRQHTTIATGPAALVWGGGYDSRGNLVSHWARYDANDGRGGNRELDAVVESGPAVADAIGVMLDEGSTFALFGGQDADGPRADMNVCEVASLRCVDHPAVGSPPRRAFTATPIGDDGWILLLGGSAAAPVELVRVDDADVIRLTGAAAEGVLSVDRREHRAARLDTGRVLVTGGRVDGLVRDEAFIAALVPRAAAIEYLP